MSRLTWTTCAVLAWPLLGLLSVQIVGFLPDDRIWSVALAAAGWSLLPWMGLSWPIWTAVVARVGGEGRPWMLVSLLGLAVAGVPVQCVPAAAPSDGEPGTRVAVFNVNAYSPDKTGEAVFSLIHAHAPDVVVILERRFEDIPGYERIADDFPGDWPRPSHHTAVYRAPGAEVAARVTGQLGSKSMAMPLAIVWIERTQTCLLAVHSPPQVPKDASGMGPYVNWIAVRLSEGRVRRDLAPCPEGAAVVMSGDFNHVPASGPIRRFEDAGLRDVLAGTGLHGLTWPSGGGWPDFPVFRLDHVLAGPVSLTELVKTRVPGSDHQGWVFTVSAEATSR